MKILIHGGMCLLVALGALSCSDSDSVPHSFQSLDTANFTGFDSLEAIGPRTNTSVINGVLITEGSIRPRRRHENDMDYSKYNPFYWEGRQSKFKVEDFTEAGEKRLKFTLTTEWPQDYIPTRGPDFSAIYTGSPSAPSETTRSKFNINIRMNHIADFRVFEAVLGPNEFAAFGDKLRTGAVLTFEFRFFLNESFANWQKQKTSNPHNISAYYSEFLRIKIGTAGLLIDNPDNPEGLPSPMRFSGGWTTIPTVRVEPWKALQQEAWNILPGHSQDFMNGRAWFHTDLVNGQHVQDESDDKPTTFFEEMRKAREGFAANAYNVRSCSTCHINNGTSLLPANGQPIDTTIVKTFDRASGQEHSSFGGQLQGAGAGREGLLKVLDSSTSTVSLNDGTQVFLRKPNFRVETSLSQNNLGISPRRPQAMIGMGLLDAVPESTIRDLATRSKGEFQVINGRIGRFGWKADKTSLLDQIAAALRNDMGVLSNLQKTLDCKNSCQPGKAALPDQALSDMESYIALLGVPPRFNPTSPLVVSGEKIFDRLNCASCHVKALQTGDSKFAELSRQSIQPFTDLLLHDMGPGLADDLPSALGSKWRTAPLWGLKNVKHATDSHRDTFPPGNINILWVDAHRVANNNPIQLLHDGRATSLMEAILWHGGEATPVINAYKALNATERRDLESYLWDL